MQKIKSIIDIETKGGQQFMRQVAKEAAREAVQETLSGIGLDVRNPQALQADLLYLKRLRLSAEFTRNRFITALIAVIVPAFLYILWEMLKNVLQR